MMNLELPRSRPGITAERYGRHIAAGHADGRMTIPQAAGLKQISVQQGTVGSSTQQVLHKPAGQLHGGTGGGASTPYANPPALTTELIVATPGVATLMHCPGSSVIGPIAPAGVVFNVSTTRQPVELQTNVAAQPPHGTCA